MREILNLHLVQERISAEKIRSNNNEVSAFFLVLFHISLDDDSRVVPLCISLTFPSSSSRLQIIPVPTNVDKKFLYFNVLSHTDNKTITVEGGGVNATIIQSDIAATNGFVHIIDHVLGVPYTSVLEKLQTDPMLK